LVPHKALEIFEQMKREGVKPTVVTYSALISAAEKGQQWKLALEVLEEMKAAGHGANVIGKLVPTYLFVHGHFSFADFMNAHLPFFF
jgi:pentatricopeptide repeat protein